MRRFTALAICFTSTFCAFGAAADTVVFSDHNAHASLKELAIVQCAQAMKSHATMGTGLLLHNRVQIVSSESGRTAYILSGTVREDGVRKDVSARCVASPSGRSVASIEAVDSNAVATAP